jgi:uncharacterized protein YutE (UPF0331/DUF86 family)
LGLDPEVVSSRLARLDEYLQLLEQLGRVDAKEFAADPRTYGAAERFLHLAIECVFDIGTHCIAALGLKRPDHYAEILPTLAAGGVLSPTTEAALDNLAGFRNRLVHDYFRLDHVRIHAFIRTRLDGFRLFARDVAQWLDTQTGGPSPARGGSASSDPS